VTIVDNRYVMAETLSEAWLDAVCALDDTKGRKAVHLIVRIADPGTEVPEIRDAAQWLIDDVNSGHDEVDHLPDIETTRNTIFPAAWAERHPGAEALSAYYRSRYNLLRGFPQNKLGTYFGRIVAYPRGEEEPGDQLVETIRKLKKEFAAPSKEKPRGGSHKSSRYEINIYSEACDKVSMGFPCLAHLSVHVHEGALHMQGIYRNEWLVARAYGNYLGLAELQRYIAAESGQEVGELMVTVGHVELDTTHARATKLKRRLGIEPELSQFGS
jgi:hypothetical protein